MATRKQLEQQYVEDRSFFGSVGGRWRGLAGGIILGGMIGLAVATGGAALFSALSGAAFAEMGKGTLLGLIGFFGGAGMLIGGNLWGGAGQVAGAVAAGLMAMKELEQGKAQALAKEVPGSTPSVPPEKKPLINWKIMGIGAALTGAVGATLAYTGALPSSASYILLGQESGSAMGALAAGLITGVWGSVFGVAFKPWQALKHWTDGLFEGRVNGRSTPAVEPLKETLVETAPSQAAETAPCCTPEKKHASRVKVKYLVQLLHEQPQADTVGPSVLNR